jgi:hypothetical protein
MGQQELRVTCSKKFKPRSISRSNGSKPSGLLVLRELQLSGLVAWVMLHSRHGRSSASAHALQLWSPPTLRPKPAPWGERDRLATQAKISAVLHGPAPYLQC